MKITLGLGKLQIVAALLVAGSLAVAQERLEPGFNLFSPEQDVQIGKEAIPEIEKEVEVVDDKRLTNYVAGIGQRLAKEAPGHDYPYSFKVIADPSINAFALPGGPIYVNSGLIAAADNEAQLAGVLGHEIGHVALRHGTNQASKAKAIQLPLALASGILGGDGMTAGLARLGIGLGVNSLMLKYSRGAEKQADRLGARMLADVGYDPVEMARFFEKLAEGRGDIGAVEAFFSSHPQPENRTGIVQEELSYMPSRDYRKGDTSEFARMRERAAKIKSPKQPSTGSAQGQAEAGAPAPVPSGFDRYAGPGYELIHPARWKVHPTKDEASVTIVPDDGVVRQADGALSLAKGILAGYFKPRGEGLQAGTDQLLGKLRSSNPDLHPLRDQRKPISVAGRSGESVMLEGPSPYAGRRELVWLVTAQQPSGLFYLVMISPDRGYSDLRGQYEQVVNSVRFP